MTHLTRTLVALAAILGASATIAADRLQLQDQLKDGSCLELTEDGTACPLLAVQDQDCDQLRDGTCLDGDGIPDGDGEQMRTRTRTGEDNGKGEVTRTRK